MPHQPRPALAIQTAPERRARRYLFTVCGAAIFLLVVLLSGGPGPREPIAAALVMKTAPNGASTVRSTAPTDQIRSQERLSKAIRQAGIVQPNETVAALTPHFASEIRATLSPVGDGLERLMLTYGGLRPQAEQVLNKLVENYVAELRERPQQQAQQSYQQALRGVAVAQAHLTAARTRLESAQIQRDAASNSPPVAAPPPQPNPAWTELSKQRGELERRRAELLGQLNQTHPLVQDADHRIAAISQQIEKTPQYTFADSNEVSTAAGQKATLADSTPDWERCQAEHQSAQQAHQAATQALSAAHERIAASTNDPTRAVLWAAPTAASANTPTLAFALLLAAVCAGSIALKGVPENPTFRSADLAAETLGVPVVGVIHTTGETAWLRNARLPSTTRAIKFGSEAVLVLAVASGLMLWLSGNLHLLTAIFP